SITRLSQSRLTTNPSQFAAAGIVTSRPHIVDPALLRPGRLDVHVGLGMPTAAFSAGNVIFPVALWRLVGQPARVAEKIDRRRDLLARQVAALCDVVHATELGVGFQRGAILDGMLGRMPAAAAVCGSAENIRELVERTRDFTGADLANVCREAALCALRRDINSEMVTMDDFRQSLG
ncbi:hypothetical protein IWW55_007361, partial [Coemansia sp. RSA 2706]